MPFPSVWPALDQLYHDSLDWLWPRHCDLCSRSITIREFRVICEDCRTQLSELSRLSCPRCSSTVGPHADISLGCPNCRGKDFAFCRARRLGSYEGLLRQAILQAKRSSGEPLAEELGQMLGDQLVEEFRPHADALVPIPLHWIRRWRRGYNQSLAIARGLATRLNLPVQSRWLIRQRNTPRQASVSATQRRVNLQGAFRVAKGIAIRDVRIILVDDVMTTGATAHEAARVLKQAGAAQVSLAILAHR